MAAPDIKLGAFITTLNRPHLLRETLSSLLRQTRPPNHVVVVDNGDSSVTRAVVAEFPTAWVSYHGMEDNVGPAGAAAFALDRLTAQGYDWIYWGDDDNPAESSDTIERLLALAVRVPADVGAVGAVGANWDWHLGETRRLADDALTGLIDVDVIGGGQQLILRAAAVSRVGLPDCRLFFGFEELEYCLRIRRAGYRLVVDGDMMRECRVRWGRLDLDPREAKRREIPMWRRYYSTRNYIFAMKSFERPDLARHEMLKSFGRAFLSWRHGPQFGSAFTRLQVRGVIDGYLGRMGRTVLPVPKYDTTNRVG